MDKKMMLISSRGSELCGYGKSITKKVLPLNLAYIISLTPCDWEVDVIDENFELAMNGNGEIAFAPVSLVCFTVTTAQASRSYQIATACKKMGMTVIIGGVHASLMPEEAANYADAVFIGEAEEVWPQVIKDFESGKLKKVYQGGLPSLSLKVYPNREFLKKKYNYKLSSIITTKGCPNYCDFCSVPIFQKRKYRERNCEDVLCEMIDMDYENILLTDDNFYGHSEKSHERARSIFEDMVNRGIKKNYIGATTLGIGNDSKILRLMADSGCVGILVGIESTNRTVLQNINKQTNLKLGIENFKDCIKKIHDVGIAVWASAIFGVDGDDKDSFKSMTEFVLKNNIDIFTFGINCPFPKTRLYEKLNSEKRIFRKNYPDDWQYYDTAHLVHYLKDMTLEELIDGFQYLYDNIYSRDSLRSRFKNSIKTINNHKHSIYAHKMSAAWKLMLEEMICELKKLYKSGDYYNNSYVRNGMVMV